MVPVERDEPFIYAGNVRERSIGFGRGRFELHLCLQGEILKIDEVGIIIFAIDERFRRQIAIVAKIKVAAEFDGGIFLQVVVVTDEFRKVIDGLTIVRKDQIVHPLAGAVVRSKKHRLQVDNKASAAGIVR